MTLFRPATPLMVQYAHYHRDRRNIATHLVGIPLITLSVGVLLLGPSWTVAGHALTLAWCVWALTSLWYLSRGDLLLGMATALVNGALIALAHQVPSWAAAWALPVWLMFELIPTKLPHYILPTLPALCLMAALATNDEIKEAKLTMRRAGGQQEPFLIITLKSARISSVQHDAGSDGEARETVAIVFTDVEVEYRKQGASGGRGASTVFTDSVSQSV